MPSAAAEKLSDGDPESPLTVADEGERVAAPERVRKAMEAWAAGRPGDRPQAGGIADGRPTAPGLHDSLGRLQYHVRAAMDRLTEMQAGAGGRRWKIVERLDVEDIRALIANHATGDHDVRGTDR